MADPIAYMVSVVKHATTTTSTSVWCTDCYELSTTLKQRHPQAVPLYVDNITPYKQSCHMCGAVIVMGRTGSWPELFPEVK
jgi:hypothetical protein